MKDTLSPTGTEGLPGPMDLFRTQADWLQHLGSLSAAVTQFAADRVQGGIRAQRRLMACRSLPEVQAVQIDFATRAVAAYVAEAGRLMDLGQSGLGQPGLGQPGFAGSDVPEPEASPHRHATPV